ncbi:MAG: DUF6057 family protein [Bacteroidales bacterium]|nr:DUF6057 family protein [Bacteroidales bacterium]
MSSRQRLIAVTVAMAFFAAIVGYFQLYRFYGITADNQFLLDFNWAKGHLACPGGLTLIVSSFLTQFFIYPVTGVIVSTVIYGVIIFLLTSIFDRQAPGYHLYGLTLLPVIFLFLSVENGNYSFHGHLALLAAVVALWLYSRFHAKFNAIGRFFVGLLAGAVLYWAIGSAALVFAGGVFVYDILNRRLPVAGLASFVGIFIMAFWAVSAHAVFDFKEALTPLMYYNWPSSFFFPTYSWISVLLCIIIDKIAKLYVNNAKTVIYISSFIAIVVVAIGGNMFRMVYNGKTYLLRHEGYLADKEDWDGIIALHKGDKQPVFFVSYLNLALAQKGELLSRMYQYNQMDLREKLGWHPTSKEGLQIKGCVYYHMGYLGAARQAIFEYNMITPGSHNPAQLVKLAEINQAMGAEAVSQKYLYMAHRAPLYADFTMKKNNTRMPVENRFLGIDGMLSDLGDIVNANNDNHVAKQFYEAYRNMYDKLRMEADNE